MDYTDRISYSQVQMLQSLEGALDRLNTFRYDGNFRTALPLKNTPYTRK